jgi:hypothetical protein
MTIGKFQQRIAAMEQSELDRVSIMLMRCLKIIDPCSGFSNPEVRPESAVEEF